MHAAHTYLPPLTLQATGHKASLDLDAPKTPTGAALQNYSDDDSKAFYNLAIDRVKMPSQDEALLDPTTLLAAFREVKEMTDTLIMKNNMNTYCQGFMPLADEISIAIYCNAFEELGCSVRSSAPGTELRRLDVPVERRKLVDHMYKVLHERAGIINLSGGQITRTTRPCPSDDIETMIEELLDDRPEQDGELGLMEITGPAYAGCVSGKVDALELLFGSDEARRLMTNFYARSALFSAVQEQLSSLLAAVSRGWASESGPLRILEVGAGTGGTTYKLVPVLARLGVPVVYTMTDIGSSFGAAAQSKLERYPFLEFKVVDIEKEPDASLIASQHMILGSNVVHATRDLSVSLANIHKMLRTDGFLVLHELTTPMLWVDVAFGLIPGLWRFDDGRDHALQSPEYWAKIMGEVGFGHVDWTDGQLPETKLQALIFAMASTPPSK